MTAGSATAAAAEGATAPAAGRLAGKVVIVTGAARGMGAAEARLFAREGAAVVLVDVRAAEGEAVTQEISAAGGHARFVAFDVSSADGWQRAVAVALDAFGRIDGLVNNAAICPTQTLEQTTMETWERVVAVNQTGPLLGMQAVIPQLRRAGRGSIVNVSSVMASLGSQGGAAAAYGASKAALTTLSKGAAMELGADDIRVNSLHPGNIDTPLAREAGGEPGSEARLAMARMSPLAREGRSEEVAAAALFLLSDESSFMTGSELVVDGGYSIH